MFSIIWIIVLWLVIRAVIKSSRKSEVHWENASRTPKKNPPKTVITTTSKDTATPQSTTEMLRQKALQEHHEDLIEAQKQKMRNKRHYGELNYAGRYMPGDSVPQSRRIVICPYCNAENLVPRHDNTSKYNCYFCREKL